ncbi:uncharacterized protein NFIA_093370 [Aspergillus fischeri NRRL 181]|uniref:Uncharacterized protein n=1 Tax=Neosartorya fischeri (strain ATCC 1020 / DSM 3700 / CBS 544.65 / FGSC A1164 / JCM 1740 / NRRL 181 / WB 181) TaxID=331117 RepID=A1DJ17_NEOFI|nr:uncharacterized protein NFIA_093370 [Aspergillus fischeri NRRL 181]EAW19374.1 hypothetical protein NFIA_093370 [Aspergillus fischeri NRRL 181]
MTKGRIGDSPQAAPAQAHLTRKVEGTSPSDTINYELLSTYTALVDAESSNCVLDDPNDNYNSAESYDSSYNSLADNVMTDTAESEFVSRHDPKRPN